MKKSILFTIAILLGATMLNAQAQSTTTNSQRERFEEFRKRQQAQFANYKQKQQEEYNAFRRRINEQYADFIQNKWRNIQSEPAVEPQPVKEVPPVVIQSEPKPQPQDDTQPHQDDQEKGKGKKDNSKPLPDDNKQQDKPKDSPQDTPKDNPQDTPQDTLSQPIQVEEDIVVIPRPTPAPEPIAPVVVPKEQPTKKVSITFYGTPVSISFPENDNFRLQGLKETHLSEAWKTLSSSQYDATVSNLLSVRSNMRLCDWAYYTLIVAITEKQYGKTNDAVFAQVFLMTQSGYRVRMATSKENKKLYLLLASQYNICSLSFLTLDGQRFYIANAEKGVRDFYVCEAKYDKEHSLCMQISTDQAFAMQQSPTRKLTSKKGLTASVSVNSNAISFFNTYPRSYIEGDSYTTWVAYANTPMESAVRNQLYPVLKKATQGMSQRDAVGLILNWVQTAFQYEYDDKVWGGDRPFFPTETLFYPYCDCEDRSILFSRIVRDVLNLKVVLLYYPGHLATAVQFTDNVNGDFLLYNNKKYIVCDPTYIGASVGMTMPGMDNQQAKVVVLQ